MHRLTDTRPLIFVQSFPRPRGAPDDPLGHMTSHKGRIPGHRFAQQRHHQIVASSYINGRVACVPLISSPLVIATGHLSLSQRQLTDMPAPGPLYVHERPVRHSDFRIGQSYHQDFIEQTHLEARAQTTILIIFVTPDQVKCGSSRRLKQAMAQRYITSKLHVGSKADNNLRNGTVLWWKENDLEVVELMSHDPLLRKFRSSQIKLPDELYVFVQRDYWIPGVPSEFVFRGRFHSTTMADIQAHPLVAALYQPFMSIFTYEEFKDVVQTLHAALNEAAPMSGQESASVQASVRAIKDAPHDGVTNGPADAIVEVDNETDDDTTVVEDINWDHYIDISDNEDSEDASTCRSPGEQTDDEDRVVMDLDSCS